MLTSILGRGADAKEALTTEAVKYAGMKMKPLVGGVAFMASPVASNEDLMAGFAFARDVLKAKEVYVSGRPHGEADFFLMQADKNPNRTGLEWIAKAAGLTLRSFTDLTTAMDAGTIKGLYAIGAEVPEAEDVFAKRAEKLDLFVVSATNTSQVTAAAHAVLAAASHAEDEGTFTQEAGITQRFRRAFPPKGASQPHWKWAVDLALELGTEIKAMSSRDIFRAMAPNVPELKDFAWDKLAPMSQSRPGIATMAAGADGRPPGWREQGVPSMRGLNIPQGT